MTIVTDGSSRAGGHAPQAVEQALAAAIADSSRIGELLDELSQGRLWLPLPDDGRPVTDGSAVNLPTVTYLGSVFVPAFTSAARLRGAVPRPRNPQDPGPGAGGPAAAAPHIVVPAAGLARRLPPEVGIALNAGAGESVPIYPEGVAYLAAAGHTDPDTRIRVGPLPFQPEALLAGIRSGLRALSTVAQAAAAWLQVELAGEGLVISVTLDDPADTPAQQAAIRVVERAALAAPQDSWFPVDVTFPGEGTPDVVDRWFAAGAEPFYRRS